MSEQKVRNAQRYKCRNAFCPNQYDEAIGGAMGLAVCIPCLYAEQMVDHGQTIEQIEKVPALMELFIGLLNKAGWTWQDMKDSHFRMLNHVPSTAKKSRWGGASAPRQPFPRNQT